MNVVLQSVLTCPSCGARTRETMPTDACLYFHTCAACGAKLKPKPGDCCVFCSYGSVPCPPVQENAAGSGCRDDAATAPWTSCSLDRSAFQVRLAEIAGIVDRFAGQVAATPDGMELRFRRQDGLLPVLDALVAKERECCATLQLSVAADGGSVVLRVVAPEGDRAAIQAFAARLQTADRASESM